MRPGFRAPRGRGFTLIELMVTLVVLSVLLGVAVPGLQALVAAQRMRAVSYDLVTHLLLARSEALKRGAPVQVLPATGGWERGWSVRAGATQLARHDAPAGLSVTTAPGPITFDLHGRVVTADPQVRIGFTDGERNRCISLDPAGRPKTLQEACPA